MNGLLSPSKTFVSINMPTESTFEDELPNVFNEYKARRRRNCKKL